jgi:hypothetical protein
MAVAVTFFVGCAATQLRNRQKKAMATIVAFFMELRCSAIPQ